MVWNTPLTCDTNKWESATACNGVSRPWGYNKITNYNPTTTPVTKGSIRAWHFLADVGADLTKVMSIEKGQTLRVFLYEFRDKKPGACATTGSVAYTTASGTSGCQGATGSPPNKVYEYAWWVQEVVVSGAASQAVGFAFMASAIAGILF